MHARVGIHFQRAFSTSQASLYPCKKSDAKPFF